MTCAVFQDAGRVDAQITAAGKGQFAIGRSHAEHGAVVHGHVGGVTRCHDRAALELHHVRTHRLWLQARREARPFDLDGIHRHFVAAFETNGGHIRQLVDGHLARQALLVDSSGSVKG